MANKSIYYSLMSMQKPILEVIMSWKLMYEEMKSAENPNGFYKNTKEYVNMLYVPHNSICNPYPYYSTVQALGWLDHSTLTTWVTKSTKHSLSSQETRKEKEKQQQQQSKIPKMFIHGNKRILINLHPLFSFFFHFLFSGKFWQSDGS